MEEIINRDYVYGLGYELCVRSDYFILEGISPLALKGSIVDGRAKNVRIVQDSYASDLSNVSPDKAIAYAYKLISTAYFARSLENMIIDTSEAISAANKEE